MIHVTSLLFLVVLLGGLYKELFTHRTRWPSPPFNLLAEVIFECQDTDVYQLDPMLPDRLFCSNHEWIGQHPKCVTINRQQQPHFALTGNDRVSLMAPSLPPFILFFSFWHSFPSFGFILSFCLFRLCVRVCAGDRLSSFLVLTRAPPVWNRLSNVSLMGGGEGGGSSSLGQQSKMKRLCFLYFKWECFFKRPSNSTIKTCDPAAFSSFSFFKPINYFNFIWKFIF